jgi:hypothetical protein
MHFYLLFVIIAKMALFMLKVPPCEMFFLKKDLKYFSWRHFDLP